MSTRSPRASVPSQKQRLLVEWQSTRNAILTTADALAGPARNTAFLGTWSAKDLLAHLAGWDEANREAAEAIVAGRLPAFYAQHGPDWRAFNAQLVARHKCGDYRRLRAGVNRSYRELLDYLESLPAEEFTRDHGVRFKGVRVTVASVLRGELKDEQEHYRQIREFAAQSRREHHETESRNR